MEKEGATFSCEVSHDEVPGLWFRESSKLRPSDNVRIRQEGQRAAGQQGGFPRLRLSLSNTECPLSPGRTYTLIFRRVLAEDAGEIKFVAENAESRAHLRVKGEEGSGEDRDWTWASQTAGLPQAWGALGPLPDKAAVTHGEGRMWAPHWEEEMQRLQAPVCWWSVVPSRF